MLFFIKNNLNDLICEVSKHFIYMAKTRAVLKINSNHRAQYVQVWDNSYELKRVFLESVVKILCEDLEAG